MKRRDLQLYAQTDIKGNFLIGNKQDMNDFFKSWKNSFFTLSIEVHKVKPLSVPLLVYYKKKVVADFKAAYFKELGERYTLEQTDEKLRELSPITRKETYNFETKKWEHEILEVEQLDNQQLVFFIDHLKQLGLENFGVYVEDPNSIIL